MSEREKEETEQGRDGLVLFIERRAWQKCNALEW